MSCDINVNFIQQTFPSKNFYQKSLDPEKRQEFKAKRNCDKKRTLFKKIKHFVRKLRKFAMN